MVSHKGRVLLLEDDAAFSEIIRAFLTENGYTVVMVPNGGEGVREVLAGDFALVLCDLMMPTLPGDMFYRAVERIRPRLCERFVFMTGYHNDPKTSDFIRNINGYVLRKPFHMRDLLASLEYAELRGTFQAVFESPTPEPAGEPDPLPALPVPVMESVRPPASPAAAPADLVHFVPARVRSADEPSTRNRVAARMVAPVCFAAIVVLGAVLGTRHVTAQRRAAAAAAELRTLEAEWKVLAVQLEHAEAARSGFTSLPKRARRIAEERAASGWTAVLRALEKKTGPGIALRDIAARGIEGAPGACELRVAGVATGRAPRVIADDFREALGRELERKYPGLVATELETLADETETPASAGQPRVTFAISVRIGRNQPARGEGVTMK